MSKKESGNVDQVVENAAHEVEMLASRLAASNELIASKISRVQMSVDRNESLLLRIEGRVDSNFKWLLGTMLGGFIFIMSGLAGILGVMAHGFNWI